MSLSADPPRWAEAMLRAFLKPGDFESISGDLLEQYRDSISPARGELRANLWYVGQVLTFVSPATRLFAVLFSAQFLFRTALDWFLPVQDFHFRSTVSTALGTATLVAAGFCAAWRSRSLVTGAISGSLTAGIASIISIIGSAAMLAIWHGPQTITAIHSSGGFAEVVSLPLLMILPGALFGTCGGVAGAGLKRLLLASNQGKDPEA